MAAGDVSVSQTTAILIVILSVMVLIASGCVALAFRLLLYNRTKKWLLITQKLLARFDHQVLLDEMVLEAAKLASFDMATLNRERKEMYPLYEETACEVPAAAVYVDPFKAPSNMYEQMPDDQDEKTCRQVDGDIFTRPLEKNNPKSKSKQLVAATAEAGNKSSLHTAPTQSISQPSRTSVDKV